VPGPYTVEFVPLPAARNAPGVDYRLALHVYPDPGPPAPVVVIFPAMGTPARYYRPFAQRLGAEGLAVIVVDLRGTGDSTPPASVADRYGYAELAGDVGVVLDAVKPRLDGRRYYLLGHSLGGQACTLHLALTAASGQAPDPAGLILVAVGLPYYRSYPRIRRLGVLAFTQAIVAVTAVLRVWPGWAFGGRQARGVIRDWGYTARHGRFPAIGGRPVDLSLVRTPVVAISVGHDQFTPHETLDFLCDQLPRAPITRIRLDEPRLDHFSWIRNPDAVANHIVSQIVS
jgi:predicted alpha/beta hydrolase